MCLICFIAIFVLYFFQSYQIRYDGIQQSLIIKKWYGTINIPKSKLKKVYIKSSRRAGANLYIGYLNDKNKEKYILLDIFLLKCNELKDFLDIFIIFIYIVKSKKSKVLKIIIGLLLIIIPLIILLIINIFMLNL